ncbi:MAG: hypothetical protein U9O63_06325 [Actinomycetota bacterium]|nr:hypothetical protein [Actinomycetota bacterium]
MEPLGVVALVFGTLLIVGGMGVVAWRELATHPERRLVGRLRDVIEVLLPVIGIVILVAITWAVVAR